MNTQLNKISRSIHNPFLKGRKSEHLLFNDRESTNTKNRIYFDLAKKNNKYFSLSGLTSLYI